MTIGTDHGPTRSFPTEIVPQANELLIKCFKAAVYLRYCLLILLRRFGKDELSFRL